MKGFSWYSLLLSLALCSCASEDRSTPTPSDPRLRTVAAGLAVPWEIVWGPDGWIWMTERKGTVSRIEPETGERRTIATIAEVHEGGEAGLLGMALWSDSGGTVSAFLVYTYLKDRELVERLVRYRYDAVVGRLVEPRTLLDGIPGTATHDGSRLTILPDRTLLMTTGDAQQRDRAQDRGSLNGKILRLNLDGSIPDDNPFPGSLVWSSGHRNPQGLVSAPNGLVYSSEHGAVGDDEINIIEKGRNYGWPLVEGVCDREEEKKVCNDSAVVEPIRAWTPTLAVAGMAYYGSAAIATWKGSLLLATLKDGFHQLKLDDEGRQVISDSAYFSGLGRIRDVCISPTGRVFICTSNRDGRGSPRDGDDRIIEVRP